MKLIVQAIILFLSIGAFACDCDEPGITEKYQHSDFIADVTILKIYPNTKNESGYKAVIQVNKFLLVGIFYYPADKTNKSFLSHYYL